MALVLLISQANFTSQLMQSLLYFMFCLNKLAVLIAIHWKILCEIIKDAIGETP